MFHFITLYIKQILCFDVNKKKKPAMFTTNRDIFLVFFRFERILFYEGTPKILCSKANV